MAMWERERIVGNLGKGHIDEREILLDKYLAFQLSSVSNTLQVYNDMVKW